MKLLFVIGSLVGGGAEKVLVTLANAFVEKGYDVSVACNTDVPQAYVLDDRVELVNLNEGISKKNGFFDKLTFHIRRVWKIRGIIKKLRPDIVVSFMRLMNVEVLMGSLGLGVPIIATEHSYMERRYGIVRDTMAKMLYPLASAVTVLTRYDYSLNSSRISNFVYMTNPMENKSILSIPMENRNKVVLASGRLDAWHMKGFDMLIDSWSKICHKYPDWRLQFAGTGKKESFDYLQGLSRSKNCINVDFLGFCDNLSDLMSQSSIFALSSRLEGLSMVLIEAMQAGCACISFDCVAGPNEIIKNDFSGLLVKPQSIDEMTKKLEGLMENESLRIYLSSNSEKTIQKYSLNRILNRWEILFAKVS